MRYSRLGSFVICFLYALTQVSVGQQPVLCKICDDAVLCGTEMPQSFNCTNEFPCSIRQYWLCRQLVQPGVKPIICDRPGKYPHPESSSMFYNCVIDNDTLQFEAKPLHCPLNTTFNTLTARCLTQEETNTLNFIDKSIIFNRNNTEFECKNFGTYMDDNDCKVFHVCNEKLKPQVFSCSRGRYFNGAQCKPSMSETCVAQLNKISEDQTARFEELYKRVESFISKPPTRNCSIRLKTSQMIDITVFNSISANLNNNLTEQLNIEDIKWQKEPHSDKDFENTIKEFISNNRDKDDANKNYNNKNKIVFLDFGSGNVMGDLKSIAQGVSGDGRNTTGLQPDVYVYTINGKLIRIPKYHDKSQKHHNIFSQDDLESVDVLDHLDHKEKSDDPQKNRKPGSVHDELETVDLLDHLEHNHSDNSGEISSFQEESDPKSDSSSEEREHMWPEIPEREYPQKEYVQPIKIGAAENMEHDYPKGEPKIFEYVYFPESTVDEHNTDENKVNKENREFTKTYVNKESDGKRESKDYNENRESKVYEDKKEPRVTENYEDNKDTRESEAINDSIKYAENKQKRESNIGSDSNRESLLTTTQENYEITFRTTEGIKEDITESTIDLTEEIITETSTQSTTEVSTTEVNTTQQEEISSPTPEPQNDPVPDPFSCLLTGNFADPNDCSKYYRCRIRGGELIAIPEDCSSGKYFFPFLGICIRRRPNHC